MVNADTRRAVAVCVVVMALTELERAVRDGLMMLHCQSILSVVPGC
jgi:hypothetical protein